LEPGNGQAITVLNTTGANPTKILPSYLSIYEQTKKDCKVPMQNILQDSLVKYEKTAMSKLYLQN